MNRAAGNNDAGFRWFFWGLFCFPAQLLGLFAVAQKLRLDGASPDAGKALWLLGLFLFFAWAVPALLYAGIVGGDRVPFRRSFAFGLLWSLVSLAFFVFALEGRPLINALLNGLAALLTS